MNKKITSKMVVLGSALAVAGLSYPLLKADVTDVNTGFKTGVDYVIATTTGEGGVVLTVGNAAGTVKAGTIATGALQPVQRWNVSIDQNAGTFTLSKDGHSLKVTTDGVSFVESADEATVLKLDATSGKIQDSENSNDLITDGKDFKLGTAGDSWKNMYGYTENSDKVAAGFGLNATAAIAEAVAIPDVAIGNTAVSVLSVKAMELGVVSSNVPTANGTAFTATSSDTEFTLSSGSDYLAVIRNQGQLELVAVASSAGAGKAKIDSDSKVYFVGESDTKYYLVIDKTAGTLTVTTDAASANVKAFSDPYSSAATSFTNTTAYYLAENATTNDEKVIKLASSVSYIIQSHELADDDFSSSVAAGITLTGATGDLLKFDSQSLGTAESELADGAEITVKGTQALEVAVKGGVLVAKNSPDLYVAYNMSGKLQLATAQSIACTDCNLHRIAVSSISSSKVSATPIADGSIENSSNYALVVSGKSFSLTGATNLEYVPSEAKVPAIANYADFKDAKKWNIVQSTDADSVLLKTTEGYLQYKVEDGTVSMSVADKATSKFFLGAEAITSKYGNDKYALKLDGGVSLVKDGTDKVNIYADITPNTDGSGTSYDEDGTVIGVPGDNAVLYFNIGKQYLVVDETGAVVLVDKVADGQEKNASWVFEHTGDAKDNTGYYKSVATGMYLTVADDAIETKAAATPTIFALSNSKTTIIEVSTADNSVTVVNDAISQTPATLGFANGKLTTSKKAEGVQLQPAIATLQKSNEVVVPAVIVGTYVDGDNYVAGEYYVLSIGGDKAVRYDAENKKCILVASADNASALDLWKMVETKVGDKYTYSFVSKSDDKVFFTVGGENTFIGGVKSYKDAGAIQLRTDGGKYVTVNAQGELALEETTDKAVVLCQAGVMPYSAATLNALEGAGFSLTIDVKKDAKATVKGADMFAGKLTAVESNGGKNTTYQLKTADGKFIVLLQKDADNAAWGTGSDMNGEGTYKRGYKFATVDKVSDIKTNYSYFRISHAAGSDSKDLIVEVMPSNVATTAFGRLYIAKVDGEYLLTTTNGKATTDVYPYVVAGSRNTVKIKDLVKGGRFVNISYANSKKVTGTDGNLDRFGKVYTVGLNTLDQMVVGYAKLNTEVLASSPETQWAITGSDDAITFTNREQPTVAAENLVLYATGTPNVYSVESSAKTVTDANSKLVTFRDTIRLTYVEDITKYDGFMFAKENQLRNQRYNLSAINQVGNVTQKMYWAENQGTHKIGLDGDVENAGKWQLSLDKKADKDGNLDALIDTVLVISTVSIIKDDKVKEVADTLAILPYLFQNADNNEFVKYNDKSLEAGDFYICDKNKVKANATRFALKMRPDSTYHFVTLNKVRNADNTTTAYGNPFVNKIYAGSSTNLLNHVANYSIKGNDLMSVTPLEVPEYREVAFGDTIRIYREENPSQVVYEKRDASVLVEGKAPSFLNIDNVNQFKDINPAIFVDTAYVNREAGENTRYQYLLAVNVEEMTDAVCPLNPEHNTQAWRDEHNNGKPCPDAVKSNYVRGRFLINLMDTANVYESKQLHSKNPYIDRNEAGEPCAKLAFVEGYHLNDTLFIQRGNGEYVKLELGTPEFNIAKFAFHYVDYPAGTFKIQTQGKLWKNGDLDEEDANYQDGYLKWINGTVVVTKGFAAGDVFNLNEDETRIPTANESINGAAAFSVATIDGAVVISGAEGKNVTITNVLGQTIASTVIASSEATIAVPAGVVVVAVEGEAAVKAIVK